MTAAPIPAATLILFREREGATEHLFVERALTMTFAAGAVVFPGGRIDAGDRMLAEPFDIDQEDAAARIAAIRETIEETGIAAGLAPQPDAVMLERLRAGLNEGRVFADLLAAADLAIDPAALVPFARWCPNFAETRNYDTRFYLAHAPANAEARVDATENTRVFWATAQAVLEEASAGRAHVIFPTLCNLERLAMLGSFDRARAQTEAIAPELVTPWIEQRNGAPHLCIPEDRGYPNTAKPMTSLRRG